VAEAPKPCRIMAMAMHPTTDRAEGDGARAGLMAAWALSLAISALWLTGCEEKQAEVEERIRAIKTVTIADHASGRLHKFPGIVEAVDTSSVSFEVAGNTREVNVKVGDRVAEGQVLATLDETPFQLNVEGAEAALARARAQLAEKETQYQRQSTLYEKGWVAKSAYDEALAARESVANEVAYAASQLALARRDLEKTELAAPFDGIVAQKYVDPFQEVARGEKVFEIYREGDMEAVISVPESLISDVELEMPGQIVFPAEQVKSVAGEVSEIGTVAGDANAFPVKVALADPPENVLPGMTAEVALTLGQVDGSASYLVPLSAIAAGDAPGRGYVFVFDPDSSTVTKTQIGGRGVEGDRALITGGIAPGDVIAVAGVTFLHDGQTVELMSERGASREPSQREQRWGIVEQDGTAEAQ